MFNSSVELKRRALFKLAGAGIASLAVGSTWSEALASGSAYVPDEAVEQTRVWMAFPNSSDIWGYSLLKKIQKDWALVCRTIAQYEPVFVVCGPASTTAKAMVGKTVHPVTYISTITNDDMWMRDSGCVFRRNGTGGLEGIQLNFNGWGRQQISTKDSRVAAAMCSNLKIPVIKASVVGEGGGVIYDGDGTLVANWSSWTGHNRNPGKTKDQVGAELLRVYNAKKIIWCDGIIGHDITDLHIDSVCNFIRPGVLAMHRPPSGATDIWSKNVVATYKKLKDSVDAKSRSFQFIFLDEPENPRSDSADLLNTYINYLVVNGAVITSNFGDTETDASAKAAFTAAYPGLVIEMLNLDNIYGYGGGGVHCITQQQPVA
jgi:agmatine deiminase